MQQAVSLHYAIMTSRQQHIGFKINAHNYVLPKDVDKERSKKL